MLFVASWSRIDCACLVDGGVSDVCHHSMEMFVVVVVVWDQPYDVCAFAHPITIGHCARCVRREFGRHSQCSQAPL